MIKGMLAGGTVHKMPRDLKKALTAAPAAKAAWLSLTPLARNEWICWDVTVKQPQEKNTSSVQLRNCRREPPTLLLVGLYSPHGQTDKSVSSVGAR